MGISYEVIGRRPNGRTHQLQCAGGGFSYGTYEKHLAEDDARAASKQNPEIIYTVYEIRREMIPCLSFRAGLIRP